MKLKNALSLLLILTLCMTTASCVNNLNPSFTVPPDYEVFSPEPNSKNDISPLLYKVTDQKGDFIWLFVSISNPRKKFYDLPDYVNDAFDSSEYLAVKFDTISFNESNEAKYKAISNLVFTDETDIKDHVSSNLYEEAKLIIDENVVYTESYEQYIAAYWATIIDSLVLAKIGQNSEMGIDDMLIVNAKKENKEIKEMESFEYQYQVMASYSDELQEMLLEASVESYYNQETIEQENNLILDAWASGDVQTLKRLSGKNQQDFSDKELYYEYTEKTYTERNKSLTTWIEGALESGEEIFVCLNSVNVIGENGIVDMLSARGYTVEVVSE